MKKKLNNFNLIILKYIKIILKDSSWFKAMNSEFAALQKLKL
jgi:hypothetical protein